MAMIGSWGNLIFAVSQKEIKTFTDLKWDIGAKYSTHDRHLKDPLLEFTGIENESISFSMLFSVFIGTDPMTEIEKLRASVQKGEANRLVIGTKVYGAGKWVITKISNSLDRYNNQGNLLAAKVSITMKAYAER